MALSLTGVEITLDLAIFGSLLIAAITWFVAKNQERSDKEKGERDRNYVTSVNKLNEIMPATQRLITFIEKGEKQECGDEKLVLELQRLVAKSIIDVFGCSKEVLSAVVACNNDFNHVQRHDPTNRGIKFMVYSVVNMTYKLYAQTYGEEQAKSTVGSMLPIDDASVVLDRYTEMRKSFGIKD